MPAHKWVLAHPFHSRAEKGAPPLSTQLQFLRLPEGKYCLSLNKPTISLSLSPSLSLTHTHTYTHSSRRAKLCGTWPQLSFTPGYAQDLWLLFSAWSYWEKAGDAYVILMCACVWKRKTEGGLLFFFFLEPYLSHADFTMKRSKV